MDPGPSILQTSTSTASREKSNKRVSFDAPTPKSSSPAAPSRSFRISVPGPSSKGKERLTLTRHSTGTSISSGSMPFGGLRNVDELGSASFSFHPPGASSTPLIERPERLMIQDRRRPNPLRRSGAAISLEHYRNRHPVDADEHSQSSTSSPSSARSRYSPIPPRRIDYNAIRRAAAEHEDVFGPSRASGSGTRRSSSPESQSEDQSDMEDQLDAEAQSAVAGPSNTQEVVLHRGAPPSVANLSNRPIGTINRTVRGNGMPRHARHVSPARRLEYRGQEEDRGIEEYQRKEEDRSELPSLISFRMPRMPTYHDRSPEIALDGYAPFESEFGDAPIS